MDKLQIHKEILKGSHNTYKAKNADYGDSFSKVRKEYPEAIIIRLMDKLERLKTLLKGNQQQVNDESIEDTLLDMGNYCFMELVERKIDREYEVSQQVEAVVDELMKPVSDEVAKDHAEHYWEHRG